VLSPSKRLSRWLPGPDELAGDRSPARGGALRGGLVLGLTALALAFIAVRGFTLEGGFLRGGAAVLVLGLAGPLLLVLKPFLESSSGQPDRGLRMIGVGLALVLAGVPLAWLAVAVLDHPLIHRTYCELWICDAHHGDERARAARLYLAACTVGVALGISFVAHLAAGALRWAHARTLAVWLLRAGAAAAILATSALVLASVAARARRPNPSLSAYVAALPEVVPLPAAWPTADDVAPFPWRETTPEEGEGCMVTRSEELRVWSCRGQLGLARTAESVRGLWEGSRRYAVFTGHDRPSVLRRDAAHGLLIVEAERSASRGAGEIGERVVFREIDLEPTQLDLSDIRDLTGPPLPWIAAAVLGLALAVAAMAGGAGAATADERAAALALANRYLLALAAVVVTAAPLAAAALRGLARPW
jgi:hypothetical protein